MRAAATGKTCAEPENLAFDDLVRRGERRLENWARWSLAWTAGLWYPRQCNFARLYRPDAGDVWDGIEEGEVRVPVDEDDAEHVEQFVRRLRGLRLRVVRVCYLGGDDPTVACAKLVLSRTALQELLDDIARDCARW